jgi:hypothetical protein
MHISLIACKTDIMPLIIKCLLNRQLEGEAEFRAESWTDASNKNDGSSDGSLLVAVIVLSVILILLLGGVSVVYLLYVRSVVLPQI